MIDENEQSIENFIKNSTFEKFRQDVYNHSMSSGNSVRQAEYVEEMESPKPSITGGHEVVFEIQTLIFKQNEKLEIIGTESINKDRFHVPVPADKDHVEYAANTFKKFVDCLVNVLKNEEEDEQNNKTE